MSTEKALGDLMLDAVIAQREYGQTSGQYWHGHADQAELDAAQAAAEAATLAVWKRLLEVAPEEYGGDASS